jgi:hypothetical protein
LNLLGNSGGFSEPAGLDLAPDEQLLSLVPGCVDNTAAALMRGLCNAAFHGIVPARRGVKCRREKYLSALGQSPEGFALMKTDP